MDWHLRAFLNELDDVCDPFDAAYVRELVESYRADNPFMTTHDLYSAVDNAADSGTYNDPATLIEVLRKYHEYDDSHLY